MDEDYAAESYETKADDGILNSWNWMNHAQNKKLKNNKPTPWKAQTYPIGARVHHNGEYFERSAGPKMWEKIPAPTDDPESEAWDE